MIVGGDYVGDDEPRVITARTVSVADGRVEVRFPFEGAIEDPRKASDGMKAMLGELRELVPGIVFDGRRKCWVIRTPKVGPMRGLAEFVKRYGFVVREDVRALAARLVTESRGALVASRLKDDDYFVEGLGGVLLPYQRAGVSYIVRQTPTGGVLLGDEMGLGKTVQALASVLELRAFPCVVVCPSSIVYQWAREAEKWLPGVRARVYEGGGKVAPAPTGNAQVHVVGYAMLAKKVEELRAHQPGSVIFSEAHYLKNSKSKRFDAAKALVRGVKVRIAETGTPMDNHPGDVFALLQILGRLEDFGGFWAFAKRYLDAKQVRLPGKRGKGIGKSGKGAGSDKGGACGAKHPTSNIQHPTSNGQAPEARLIWKMDGARYLNELQSKLRSFCMIRRLKSEVLPELPPKRRVRVEVALSGEAQKEYDFAVKDVIAWVRAKAISDCRLPIADCSDSQALLKAVFARAKEAADKASQCEELVRMNALRVIAARGKMEAILEWMTNFRDSGSKLVAFGVHRAMVLGVAREFGVSALTGETSSSERVRIINRFREVGRDGKRGGARTSTKYEDGGASPWLFPANIVAGGTGVDGLQEVCSNVALLEQPWKPTLIDQAEDRLARIGQRYSVTAWHFIARGTVDEFMWEVNAAKRLEAAHGLGDRG